MTEEGSSKGAHRRILLIVGYFDWFSGYQETGLAKALSEFADVSVLAGDRVSPIFTDSHLKGLGQRRRYKVGVAMEHGVRVKRVKSRELRAMVWSRHAVAAVEAGDFETVIQVMPGQLFPLAGTLARGNATRMVLYGDNAAMYAALPKKVARLKFAVFAVTKGQIYHLCNRRALGVFGYTPQTLQRLAPFLAGRPAEVLPLGFDEDQFFVDPSLRAAFRRRMGWSAEDFVVVLAGKLRPEKRFDAVLAAASQVLTKGYRVRVAVAGGDAEAARTEFAGLLSGPIQNAVTFFPFLDQSGLNAVFNAADLGVWPSMPAITIQQAMGTGLRVAIPDNDLVGHLIRDPSTGRLLNPGANLDFEIAEAIAQEVNDWAGVPDLHREDRRQANMWLSTRILARRLLGLA